MLKSAIMPTMTAGQRLRILRTLEGWPQAHVAHLLGLASQTIGFAEADRSGMLSQRVWEELAAIFGVHLEWLISERGPAFVPALRVYELREPSVQRTRRMIAEGLTTLGKSFLQAIGTRAVFRPLPGLAVLRLAQGWVIIDAYAFTRSLDVMFSEARRVENCYDRRFAAVISPHEPRAALECLPQRLKLSYKKVEALVKSWELWVVERDRRLRDKGSEDALQQIADLVSRREIPIERVIAFLESKFPRLRSLTP